MNDYHNPVLREEIIAALEIKRGKKYLDATVGGGSITKRILEAGGKVLGLDIDGDAIQCSRKLLTTSLPQCQEGKDWKLVKANFKDLKKTALKEDFGSVSGIVFDLGVSSHQLDDPKRGLSYRFKDATLDLRLDQKTGEPASELIRKIPEDKLYEIIATFGEEKRARTIARALVLARQIKPILTTGDVAEVVIDALGTSEEINKILSRVFQALRIVVNDELNNLKMALRQSWEILKPQGRVAVISFHSLEDRIVKRELRSRGWKAITKKPMRPTREEIQKNIRSRSAKLRIGEKV